MIVLLFAIIALAQEPLPSIVDQYVTEFRNDFDIRDPTRQDYRPLLANVVRLAFHFCVGDGGCDGCIDMSQPDNNGLELSVDYLEGKTAAWLDAGLSKADLYALASMVAANMALGDAGWQSDISNFEIGRTDCTENSNDEFPHPHRSPFQFFEDNFGFSPRDTTVILGAHTLGRAVPGNSGFNNFWSDNAFNLGNGFYEAIERNPWGQNPRNFQWDQPRPGNAPNLMALSADMFLVRDLNIDETNRELRCPRNFNDCDDAATLPIVESFTTNAGEAAFQQEFKEVYVRMLRSAGQGFEQDLRLICDVYDCSTVGPVTTGILTTPQETTTPVVSTNAASESTSAPSEEELVRPPPRGSQPPPPPRGNQPPPPRGGRGPGGNPRGRLL